MSVTTNGGTNKFHGVICEYLRNRVFDPTDFFTNRNGLIKPQNIQNQYCGKIGGPVIKNKLFFFSDWEGTRIQRQLSRIATAPPPCVSGTGLSYGDFDLGQVQTGRLTNYYVVDQRIIA